MAERSIYSASSTTMQELSLWGAVAPEDREMLVRVLSHYCAMLPKRLVERRMIFKANRPTTVRLSDQAAGNTQQKQLQSMLGGSLFYWQLTCNVTESTSMSDAASRKDEADHAMVMEDADIGPAPPRKEESKQEWTLEFRDLPEAGGRGVVTSRAMELISMFGDEPVNFLNSLGYEFVSEILVENHYMISESGMILMLQRPLQFPPEPRKMGVAPSPLKDLPALEEFIPIDPSGGFVLHASVRIKENSPELVSRATDDLLGFRNLMSNMVKMEPGDRLALDTRVKG